MNVTTQFDSDFEALMSLDVFGSNKSSKTDRLLKAMNTLHALHNRNCQEYHRITADKWGQSEQFTDLSSVPFLAVRLFKLMSLSSVPSSDIYRTLQSSGTTSQVTAKVNLDRATSQRQSKVLVSIVQQILGKQRLPMLIIDAPSTVKGSQFNARAAGIQGLAFFGRKHCYALNDDMSPNWEAIDAFCNQYSEQPVFIFGFTFMVWQYFVQALIKRGKSLNLANGVLLHSGGWKKLISEKVSNKSFKQYLHEYAGINRVHNFYGMAEQVGSIFVECSQGHLHAPSMADVIVRDTQDLSICENGKTGIIQVLSAVPTSYPGQSILTEDLGVIHGEDDCPCGWSGKYFSVKDRLPKAEIRGCSDTHTRSGNSAN